MSQWEMLVPQETNVVHNLIRNPGFEYNDQFFAGINQYWYYFTAAGARYTSLTPTQTTNWAARGSRGLSLALDGKNVSYVEYTPQHTAFSSNNVSLTVTTGTSTAPAAASTVYETGDNYVAVFLLTPFGQSVSVTDDADMVVTGNVLRLPEGFKQMDLLRGHSAPFFSSVFNPTATSDARTVSFTMPTSGNASGNHNYPANSLGYAVFWSSPSFNYGGNRRGWRLVAMRHGVPDGAAIVEYLPAWNSGWDRASTVFYTNLSPAFNTYYTVLSDNTLNLSPHVGQDASQPALGVSPTSEIGTTYSHHFYLDWHVDANYTAGTSPFIACGCDYRVTFVDTTTSTTYTPINPDTGDNRLAAIPTDRTNTLRSGRTKMLLAPPNNGSNADAGRNLRLRITIDAAITPTPSYTSNAALLYIDNVQLVDIAYKGQQTASWNDVEFTYLDGDISGAEWQDFAPSYLTSSGGTTLSGINTAWTWTGVTAANYYTTLEMPLRTRLLLSNTVDNRLYGGSSVRGYSQSAIKTISSEIGTYIAINNENLGASVNVNTTGVGMPELTTVTQPYGVTDGGIVQRQLANIRNISLSIDITGTSQQDLHNKRRRIINTLKFDQLSQQGDRVLRYSGSGTPVLFRVTYTAGLEFTGNVGVSFTESTAIQFVATDPYAYAETSVTTRATLQARTEDTRFYVAYKQGDAQPWVYTGMKDYRDLAVGTGTITVASPSAAGAGTLSVITTAVGTISITSGTKLVTGVGTSFAAGDVGRSIITSTNIYVGMIATYTSTTSVTLVYPFSGTTLAGVAFTMTSVAAVGVGTAFSSNVGKMIMVGNNPVGILATGWTNPVTGVFTASTATVGFFESAYDRANIAAGTAYNLVTITGNTMTGSASAFLSKDVKKLVHCPGTTYMTTTTNPSYEITAWTSGTSVTVSTNVPATGTISALAGATTMTGVGTVFQNNATGLTSSDVGKVLIAYDGDISRSTNVGRILGYITAVNAATQVVTLNNAISYAVTSTAFRLIKVTAQAAGSPYWLQTPALNWTGGFFHYHMGIIENHTNGSSAIIVGGFDNGNPAHGYGFSKYLALLPIDGKQNTNAGNYSYQTPGTGTIQIVAGSTSVTFGLNVSAKYLGCEIYVDIAAVRTYVGRIVAIDVLAGTGTLYLPSGNSGTLTWYYTSTAQTPNPDYSAVKPILSSRGSYSVSVGASNYYSIVPTGPITAMYQESASSVLVAGTFQGINYANSYTSTPSYGPEIIRLIRIKGFENRSATTSTRGAPDVYGLGVEDIEVIAWDSLAGWGTPTIYDITADDVGNIYVCGQDFTTSLVWYIGRANDGTYATTFSPLGQLTTPTYAYPIKIVTDAKFPVANVYVSVFGAPYLLIYAFFNPRTSQGTWSSPPTQVFYNNASVQSPDGPILSFLRTQAGDILAAGQFSYWGDTYVNGVARIVPRITYANGYGTVDATPAVPAAGNFALPGIDTAGGAYISSLADYSYAPTSGAYSGTGERIAFGGLLDTFSDGRYSLAFGYLEGSGNASSVRRMLTSDLGLEAPLTVQLYPIVQNIVTTNRQRFYYENNQVTRTDNLVGPTIAVLATSSDGNGFASGSPVFRSGISQYGTPNITGVPQQINIPILVRGTANAYPVITFTLFWKSSIYEIWQTETGARIRFDDIYGLRGVLAFSGVTETITLDLRPGYRSLTSNVRGNLLQFLSADSNLADFYLLAPYTTSTTSDTYRTNTIALRYSAIHDVANSAGITEPRVAISYTPRFWSFDSPKLFTDAPDTPLI